MYHTCATVKLFMISSTEFLNLQKIVLRDRANVGTSRPRFKIDSFLEEIIFYAIQETVYLNYTFD